ncbi:Sfi1 spindle body protein-domain-containing protein [Colletotrichum acutatum]|uniref:Sfi1 spindle body protein-domain-containing protein n=1 Tax=Glomerella acutata TaxID=27357 RepID=A0AAD8XHT4_GLOAC|nr:Sfi1 spindle body protein-domain-containing protein [Colletotrichum acutatum]KAK1723825.1 Sfi1 spindle body protein-domain-containing protein [Colletotrichum acutatum]
MPSLPHRPVLAPRDGISSFVSVQSSDSYYSDHEIAILHRVVTAAQENLELLPEGERLATNALFQAYDAVLPLFGIDPEEENHISRLVFRVGGERGEGSLQEKLDAVLSRMGIGLEFGSEGSRALSNNGDDENEDEDGAGAGYEDAAPPQSALTDTDRDSDTSGDESSKDVELAPREPYAPLPPSQAQASHHLYDAESPPRLTRVGLVSNHLDLKPVNHKKPPSQSYTPSTAGNTEQSRQSRQSVSGTSVQRGASDTTVQPIEASNIYPANETEAAALPIRTKPVRTVNWVLPPDITSISTGTSVGATAPESVRNGTLGSEIAEDHVVHDVETRNSRGYELGTQKPSVHALVVHESTAQEITTHQAAKQMQPVEEPSDGGIEGDKAEPVIDDEINADPDDEARYALLEWKSTKVKGYLLLLRGLSHWKQHALDKLERMAVARRHILRMRHFDPWELVTAETRIRGRRVFTSRLMASWLRRAGEDLDTEYASLAHAQRNTAQNALRHWSTSCPTPMEPRYPPRVVSIYLQQWHSACSVSQRLESHMENLYEEYGRFRILKTWSHQAASHLRDVAAFRKYHVVQGALHQWHLDSRIEVFKSKLEIKLVRSCLSRWQNGCRAPPTLGQTNAFSRGIVVDSASGRALPGPRRGVSSHMAISYRLLKTKVLGNWQRQASMVAKSSTRSRRFASHQGAHKALEMWHIDVGEKRNLQNWVQRGCFYISATHALKTWRSRSAWRSGTRKSYARCRQHVKATFTKGYLNLWKIANRAHGNLGWKAGQHHIVAEHDRLIDMLKLWRDESSRDWGTGKLLTAAWVDEWNGMSQDLAVKEDRVKQTWSVNLKSRWWSQWQSSLLQLKSREYVALDVRERNSKKAVRRLLLHWKGDRNLSTSYQSTTLRASLGSSRRGAGFMTSRTSLPLSRAVHERPSGPSLRGSRIQEVEPTADDDDHDGTGSGPDTDGVVADTPTRWTGMASSVRLPSMTPFAPLPTPFERELRERYNRSVPTAATGQMSSLSFAQAQRLSVAGTRRAATEKTADVGRGV